MSYKHITDEQVSQMPLAGARADLLEEIMTTPTLAPIPAPATSHRIRKVVGTLGAGAAVAAVITATFVVTRHATPAPGPAEIHYSAAAREAAEQTPRLALVSDGWKITEIQGFSKDYGSITYTNGNRSVEFNWGPAAGYQSNVDERTVESQDPVEPITVAGQKGLLSTSFRGEHYIVLLPPTGESFVEIHTQTPTEPNAWRNQAAVREVMSHVEELSVDEWLARMPSDVVSPINEKAAIEAGIADIGLPSGTTAADLADLGVNKRDSFNSRLAGQVVCAWIAEWESAKRAGNDNRMAAAITALEGTGEWKIVQDLGKGYWSIAWVIDDLRAGAPRTLEYEDSFGCS